MVGLVHSSNSISHIYGVYIIIKPISIFNHRLSSAFLPTNLDKLENEVVESSLKLTQELRDRIKSQGKFDEDTFYGRAMSNMMNNMNSIHKNETQIMTDVKAVLFGATDTTASQLLLVIFLLSLSFDTGQLQPLLPNQIQIWS